MGARLSPTLIASSHHGHAPPLTAPLMSVWMMAHCRKPVAMGRSLHPSAHLRGHLGRHPRHRCPLRLPIRLTVHHHHHQRRRRRRRQSAVWSLRLRRRGHLRAGATRAARSQRTRWLRSTRTGVRRATSMRSSTRLMMAMRTLPGGTTGMRAVATGFRPRTAPWRGMAT